MATLRVDEADVGFSVEGEGDPVVLFHGTTMNRSAWDMVRAALPGDHEFVMIDFPGSGESSMPTSPLTVEHLVGQAIAVMDHLGRRRFHVAGYSLGAVVALAAAGQHDDRVMSVTSLCGWATTDARMRFTFGLWRRLIANDPELFMRYAVADGFTAGAIAALEPMLDAVVAQGAASIAPGSDAHLDLDERVDIAPLLARISAPTLLIAGAEDRWVDPLHSRAIAEVVAHARVEVVPFGHLVIQEGAGVVAELMHGHLSAVR